MSIVGLLLLILLIVAIVHVVRAGLYGNLWAWVVIIVLVLAMTGAFGGGRFGWW